MPKGKKTEAKKTEAKKAAVKKVVEKSLTYDKNGLAKFTGPEDSSDAGWRLANEDE